MAVEVHDDPLAILWFNPDRFNRWRCAIAGDVYEYGLRLARELRPTPHDITLMADLFARGLRDGEEDAAEESPALAEVVLRADGPF